MKYGSYFGHSCHCIIRWFGAVVRYKRQPKYLMLGFGSTNWNELAYLSLLYNSRLLRYPASQRQECEILERGLNSVCFSSSIEWQ